MTRMWVWTFIAIDLILLIPGFYMAITTVGVASGDGAGAEALGVAALYLALPVFCIAAPYSSYRAASRDDDANAIAIAAMPIIYASFLTLMVFWQ